MKKEIVYCLYRSDSASHQCWIFREYKDAEEFSEKLKEKDGGFYTITAKEIL